MLDDKSPFDWAEALQVDTDDASFARKAWLLLFCGIAAALIVGGGVVAAGVWG